MCCITERTGYVSSGELLDIILGTDKNTIYSYITQNELYDGDNNYIRLQNRDNDNPITRILNKIQKGNDTFGNICKVNTGIQSGADKVSDKHLNNFNIPANKGDGIFVLDKNNPNDRVVINNIYDKKESNLMVPFFKNSNIHKFSTETQHNEYILYLTKEKSNLFLYPEISNHILKFKKILDYSSDNSPYLHRARKMSIFNGQIFYNLLKR